MQNGASVLISTCVICNLKNNTLQINFENCGHPFKYSMCSQSYPYEELLNGWPLLNTSVAKVFTDAIGFECTVVNKWDLPLLQKVDYTEFKKED